LTDRAAFPVMSARWIPSVQQLEPLRMQPRGKLHFERLGAFALHHLLERGSNDLDFIKNGDAQMRFQYWVPAMIYFCANVAEPNTLGKIFILSQPKTK
jgi:hypothetical protein